MSDLTLTKIRLRNSVWEGQVTDAGDSGVRPDIRVLYLDQPVEGVSLAEGDRDGLWGLNIQIPSQAVGDGVHTFLIIDGASDETIGEFSLIAGEAVSDDLRAEVDLLRAELDMLKRAFRRHCLETM